MHYRADLVDGMIMLMTPEAWTVIGTGVVILIAIATSHRHLRAEVKAVRDELRAEMNKKIDGLRAEMNGKMNGLHARMDQIQAEFGGLRERMAKLEGLLEGLREAITGRRTA